MGNEVRQAFSISRVNSSVLDPYSSNPDPDPAKKIQSGSGSRKTLNPDPDPSYFFTLSEKIQIASLLLVFIIKRSQLKDRML